MPSEKTDSRRERVRLLAVVKNDRKAAEILIEEGYAGRVARTADAKTRQLAAMQVQVGRDRKWLRQQWREAKKITGEDAHETRGEHIAVLDSLHELGVEKLLEPGVKGTPFAQMLLALTRIAEIRAKATGAADAERADDDSGPAIPFVGAILDLSDLSAAVAAEVKKQNGSGD